MILPLVAELLSRVGRHPAVEASLDELRRRGSTESTLGGLTDPAKALVTAICASSLARPVVLVVSSNRRGEELLEPVRYFFQALTRKPQNRVAILPAHDVLPYESRSPHPEISEQRAYALWSIAAGEADIVIAPVSAALQRMRDSEFYAGLAMRLERDRDFPQPQLMAHLASVGYEKQETVEAPGQFAVRGGIMDVFSPETAAPVRLEFFGDTLESLREFDANTQRSLRPLERLTLLPLTDYPRRAELLERLQMPAASRREDEGVPAAFYPGWEFHPALLDDAKSNLFELASEAAILEDEPEELRKAIEDYRARLAAAREAAPPSLSEVPPESYVLGAEEWGAELARRSRLRLEHLSMESEASLTRALPSQPTTRYHGNVAAFMAEVRGRVQAGAQVMVSAASTGEMERLADLCHENELPYRMGELDDTATGVRLAEESSGGTIPALVLFKAPLSEGVAFPEARLAIYGNADLFESLPAPTRSRARASSASFFSDLSDFKPGDYVVHVDHGIGQFDGLRQMVVDGSAGEFMLLRYAEDARLYVPLARVDLIQKYQSLGAATPQLDRLGTQFWESRKSRVRKSVGDLAQKLLALYAERRRPRAMRFRRIRTGRKKWRMRLNSRRRRTRQKAIDDVKRDLESRPADGPLALRRRRLRQDRSGHARGVQSRLRIRSRWRCWRPRRCWRFSTTKLSGAIRGLSGARRNAQPFPHPPRAEENLAKWKQGRVDIVIGTHRLLSKDVKFHDLGLLVVDEEQRFGVAHKERSRKCARMWTC